MPDVDPSEPPGGGWPEVMTVKEAAAYLRVSPSTLRLSLLAGDIPGARVGSNWRLLRSELDATMAVRQPTETIPGRSRERKGVKLGPRKKKVADAGEPQPVDPQPVDPQAGESGD